MVRNLDRVQQDLNTGEAVASGTLADEIGATSASNTAPTEAVFSEISKAQGGFARVQALLIEASSDPACAQAYANAIVREGLTPSEASLALDEFEDETKIKRATLEKFHKEARQLHPEHGVLRTARDIATAYLSSIMQINTDFLFTEGSYYAYNAKSEDDDTFSDKNVYFKVTRQDVESGLLELFKTHPAVERSSTRKDVLSHLERLSERRAFFADAAPSLNCRNGSLQWNPTAKTLTLQAHAPVHKSRFTCETDFDREARAPVFEAGLRRALPEPGKRQALAEFIGCALLGHLPAKDNVRSMAVLFGKPRSGKSSILEVFLMLFAPSVVCSAPPTEWSSEFGRAQLAGMRLNLCSELHGDPIRSAEAKRILSMETVTGRERYGQTYTFRPTALHVFATNELPHMRDKSGALGRRTLVIEFCNSLADEDVDGSFVEKVGDELPGVLAWAVSAFQEAMKRGSFTIPEGHNEAMLEIQHPGDVVMQFAHARLEPAPGDRISSADLQARLIGYASERGVDLRERGIAPAMRALSSAISSVHGGERAASNNAPHYRHVRFRRLADRQSETSIEVFDL